MNSQSGLVSFPFTICSIRACLLNGEAWFVAKDVFQALDIYWNGPKKSLRSIPDAWKGVVRLTTPSSDEGRGGGEQEISVIKEQAVYKVAFRSDKPEAEEFTNRVAEIVTTIRKTGRYEATPYEPEPRISHDQRRKLHEAIGLALAGTGYEFGNKSAEQWVYNRLRIKLHLRHIEDMHPDQFPEAMAEVKQLKQDVSGYCSFRAKLRKILCQEIIGGGMPWTPHLVKEWETELKQAVPPRPDWLLMREKLLNK